MTVEPYPLGGIEEAFAGEGPALQVELLQLIAVALEHDVALLADALDLFTGGVQLEEAQGVQAAERDHEIAILIAARVAILRPITEEGPADRQGGGGGGAGGQCARRWVRGSGRGGRFWSVGRWCRRWCKPILRLWLLFSGKCLSASGSSPRSRRRRFFPPP